MPPALLLLGIGHMRRLVLPLPLFLLWPLLLLAWLGLGLAWVATIGRPRPAGLVAGRTTLRALGELGGTRVDVRNHRSHVYLRFI